MLKQILNIVTISFSYFSELQRRQDSNLEETDYVLDIRTSVTYALLCVICDLHLNIHTENGINCLIILIHCLLELRFLQ